MNAFANALFQICVEEQSTASVETIRNAAFEKLSKGDSRSLTSISINGKSQSWNVSKPADELFTAATWAIRRYNTGVVRTTHFDFSGI